MPRSAHPAGTTADQSKPQGPPSSRGQGYHPAAPRDNTAGEGPAPGKWGHPRPNSPMSELAQLMEEPAGGPNHGRRASDNPDVEGRHLPLGANEWQAAEFMREGGWTVARVKDPVVAGMAGHRGVLHPDDYVDSDVFMAAFEAELGHTLVELHSVYSTGGRIPATLRELRGRLDACLLALSRSEANMDLFGRVTGLNPSTVDRALARAKNEEVQA